MVKAQDEGVLFVKIFERPGVHIIEELRMRTSDASAVPQCAGNRPSELEPETVASLNVSGDMDDRKFDYAKAS
jgi:hypothetical protein